MTNSNYVIKVQIYFGEDFRPVTVCVCVCVCVYRGWRLYEPQGR